MALRLGKVLNVVSSVASSASQISSSGNMGILQSITGGMKSGTVSALGGKFDLLSANNVLGTVTGIDLKKYLSLDSIGKIFNMDTDISSFIPSDLSMTNIMGDFDINGMLSSAVPTDISGVDGAFSSKESDASNAISGAMDSVSSQLTSLTDFGSTDLFSSFGGGISIF